MCPLLSGMVCVLLLIIPLASRPTPFFTLASRHQISTTPTGVNDWLLIRDDLLLVDRVHGQQFVSGTIVMTPTEPPRWIATLVSEHKPTVFEWIRIGYPFRSFEGGITYHPKWQRHLGGVVNMWKREYVLRAFDPLPTSARILDGYVPYKPIWFGLAFNWIFFALLFFILIPPYGPRIARDLWRRHRRRCVHCAYDLRGLTTNRCPECGHFAPRQRKRDAIENPR